MKEETRKFLDKIKMNTYIYTLTFILVALYYVMNHAVGSEFSMLLIAAFAFYSLGRQISLLKALEAGEHVNTHPRELAWVRGVTYLVIILMIFSVIFL